MSKVENGKGEWKPRYGIWIALDEDGMRQVDLASKIGMDPSKLSRIITGEQKRVDLDEWEQIAGGQDRPLSWYQEGPERPSTSVNRVKPGYREWSLSDVVNHFPLGLATHPIPQLAN